MIARSGWLSLTLASYNLSYDDILQVRAPALCFYVLKAPDGLYLVDGGFIGGSYLLRRALKLRGWHNIAIRGILVTHGHLDHILNISQIVSETGAWVAAPVLDADHYTGNYRYENSARVCGLLEAVGRKLFSFNSFHVDRPLGDLTDIPIWRGLTAIHLPGHTVGHTGYYCSDLRLLFSADLFASYGRVPHLPPNIFNDQAELIPSSVERALDLDLTGVIPNHCDHAPPEDHLTRLRQLHERNTG